MKGECSHSEGDQEDDAVLIQRVSLAEDGQVEEHDGQKLARFGEDEGEVVDVRETGISEGRCERRGDADQEQGKDDFLGWEGRGDLMAGRSRKEQVQEAGDGGKGRLDRVQDNRVGEALCRWFGDFSSRRMSRIGYGGDGFLKHTPGKTKTVTVSILLTSTPRTKDIQ